MHHIHTHQIVKYTILQIKFKIVTDTLLCVYIYIYTYEPKNNMATELHIPISHLDNSCILCAPALSLSAFNFRKERQRRKDGVNPKEVWKAEQKVKL